MSDRRRKRPPKNPICINCGRRDIMDKMIQVRFDGPVIGPVYKHLGECPRE